MPVFKDAASTGNVSFYISQKTEILMAERIFPPPTNITIISNRFLTQTGVTLELHERQEA